MHEAACIAHSHWDSFFTYNPASRHRRRLIKKLLAEISFDSVLDAGCGNGQLLHSLHIDPAAKIGAFDKNHSKRPPLLQQIGADYWQLDIEKKEIGRTFDLVICSEMLEHTEDDLQAARHLAHMSNRWILITVPVGPIYPTDKAMGHFRHYTEKRLTSLFEPQGYVTRACFKWGFPFHPFYRWLLNRNSKENIQRFGSESDYSARQILLCHSLYLLFYLSLPNRGTQLFYLGERRESNRPTNGPP